mgnify:CR=1 FL=1
MIGVLLKGELNYIGEDGKAHRPIMIHRALMGSIERFFGILIEHFEGAFPAWLAPVQAVIANITDNQAEYVQKVEESLKNKGFRVHADLRNEKIGFKIREHTIQRIPYLLVVGDQEMESGLVAVRTREGEDLGKMSIEELSQRFQSELASRGRN